MADLSLSSIEKRKKEFINYQGKEIGLNQTYPNMAILYGVLESEDQNNLYLKPHLAYSPLPLPTGEIVNNLEKRNYTKTIPKNLITKLVEEYSDGYFDGLIEANENRDDYIISKFNQNIAKIMEKTQPQLILPPFYKISKKQQ